MIYACDAFGDTLLHYILRVEASNENEQLLTTYLQLLLDAGFGNGSSSSNLFHMYALHTQFQELALKSANMPSSDLPKGGAEC